MKKNIEWLKKEIATEMIELEPNRKERWSDVKYQTLRDVAQKIYQLDEPEALSKEWVNNNVVHVRGLGDIFEAETVENLLVPKHELQVSLYEETINIVLDDLKEYIKEQQSLSQNAGLANTSAGNDTHYRQYDYVLECVNEYEPSDDLQNLLIPKQELPVIPKYVGEFIEEVKASGDRLDDAFSILRGIYHQSKTADWVAKENRNSETFARAWLDGYEVEEEPLYYALIKGHEVSNSDDIYWNYDKYDDDVFVSRLYPSHDNFSTEMSKSEWSELGINDSNADFVKVGEME